MAVKEKSVDDKVTMKERDEFIAHVEAQLSHWKSLLAELESSESHIPTGFKPKFHHMLQQLTAGYEKVKEKLQTLSLASSKTWQQRKVELETILTKLNPKFERVRETLELIKINSIGWAEGFAKEGPLESIGWAEGFTDEDPVKSVGWGEGFSDEDEIDSVGWGEGYEHKQ